MVRPHLNIINREALVFCANRPYDCYRYVSFIISVLFFISTNSGMFALRVFQIRNVELPQATPKHTEMVMVAQTSVI